MKNKSTKELFDILNNNQNLVMSFIKSKEVKEFNDALNEISRRQKHKTAKALLSWLLVIGIIVMFVVNC